MISSVVKPGRIRTILAFAGLIAATLFFLSPPTRAAAQAAPTEPAGPLTVVLQGLPVAAVGQSYSVQFSARGGTRPLLWEVIEGDLPPGMQLDADSGFLSGTPTSAGDYRFILSVTDSGEPRSVAQGEFVLSVREAVVIGWSAIPAVENNGISGQLTIRNNTSHSVNATVIVVALNEIDKAFALGYQHWMLAPLGDTDIPFGASLPFGAYIVHADAIAEDPSTNQIYRTALQISAPLSIYPP